MKKIFKNKKVVIMGLGLHGGGTGVTKFFYKQGANLLITDLKNKNQLKESIQKLKNIQAEFVLGEHRKEDFTKADLIVKNPAVPNNSPYLKIARKHRIPIKTDIDIFFDLYNGQIIGITGTKGKSTVATLCYLLLKSEYPDTVLAGNIGISPLEILPKIKKGAKVVLELSSFELENLKKSPHVAVITSLFPDHLDRYKSFRDYLKAKEPIFKYQKKSDILILNYKDFEAKKIAVRARSKVYFFNPPKSSFFSRSTRKGECGKNNYRKNIILTGFNNDNISAAIVLAGLFKISQRKIKKIISDFKGIPNRQELVAVKKGVKYINDTTATTPQSTVLAIKTFKNRFPRSKIILIAGGVNKNLNYQKLINKIKKEVSFLFLLPGSASREIEKGVKRFGNFAFVKSMREAVKKSSKYARKGDIVLLSPGAASFNLFKNEFERGDQFIKGVKAL